MNRNEKKIKIGEVSVDSGQILIVDPCYLDRWKDGPFRKGILSDDNNYAECCNITNDPGFGQVFYDLAVTTTTLYGDGSYPVYAIFINGETRPKRIIIDFDANYADED